MLMAEKNLRFKKMPWEESFWNSKKWENLIPKIFILVPQKLKLLSFNRIS